MLVAMSAVLGTLAGEAAEPLSEAEWCQIQERLRASAMSSVYVPRSDVAKLVEEVTWLKRRAHRVESAILPLVESLRSFLRSSSAVCRAHNDGDRADHV
jgi:hypothetical protein